MIAFDFLQDPRTVLLDRLRACKISRPLAASMLAVATATLVVASGWSIERSRALDAERSVARLRVEDAALRIRLVSEKLEAAEVADLGALDGRLRTIAGSGAHVRSRMAALAEAMPRDIWLVSLTDDGRHLAVIGRTQRLKSVAAAMSRLSQARFGAPSLARIARVERPGRALLEFSLSVGDR